MPEGLKLLLREGLKNTQIIVLRMIVKDDCKGIPHISPYLDDTDNAWR